MVGINLYEVLEVSPNASPEVIKAAYKSLAQRFHPDKNTDDLRADEKLKLINRAYEILSDARRRADYDAGLQHSFQPRNQSVYEAPFVNPVEPAKDRANPGALYAWFPKMRNVGAVTRPDYWITLVGAVIVQLAVLLVVNVLLYELTKSPTLAQVVGGLVSTYVFLRLWLHSYVGRLIDCGWQGTSGIRLAHGMFFVIWLIGLLQPSFMLLGYIAGLVMAIVVGTAHGLGKRPNSEGGDLHSKNEMPQHGPASMGLCPNCDAEIRMDSVECPKCKAMFGPNAAWKVEPLNHPL